MTALRFDLDYHKFSLLNRPHNTLMRIVLLKHSTQGSIYRASCSLRQWQEHRSAIIAELQQLSEQYLDIAAYFDDLAQQRQTQLSQASVHPISELHKSCQQRLEHRAKNLSLIIKCLQDDESSDVAQTSQELDIVACLSNNKLSHTMRFWTSKLDSCYLMPEASCKLSDLSQISWTDTELYNFAQQISQQLHLLYKLAGICAHRDLKPSNIIVFYETQQTQPKLSFQLIDFGVALSNSKTTTKQAEIYRCGTPPYMAPELQNNASKADHRADYYALGVILYELIEHTPCKAPKYFKDWLKRSGAPEIERDGAYYQRCNELIQKLTAWEACQRPQTQEELEHALQRLRAPGISEIQNLYWLMGTLAFVAVSCGYIISSS